MNRSVYYTIPVGHRQTKEVSISQYPDINVRGEVRMCEAVAVMPDRWLLFAG